MKIEEIRIGNLVEYEKTTHIVNGIGNGGLKSWWFKNGEAVIEKIKQDIGGVMVPNPYFDSAKEYSGIVITEEILRCFGFQVNEEKTEWAIPLPYGNGSEFIIEDALSTLQFPLDTLINRGAAYMYLKEIKYVHELQNLYFSLTGHELVYTPLFKEHEKAH